MHENVEPLIEIGEIVECSSGCPRYIDGGIYCECGITGAHEDYCIPWYQNRIEELEIESGGWEDAASVAEAEVETWRYNAEKWHAAWFAATGGR
jgi:hypothetical protein